jgi:hypothetical protein
VGRVDRNGKQSNIRGREKRKKNDKKTKVKSEKRRKKNWWALIEVHTPFTNVLTLRQNHFNIVSMRVVTPCPADRLGKC